MGYARRSSSLGLALRFTDVGTVLNVLYCFSSPLQVYGFRMSLWAEHLGRTDPAFHRPETAECMAMVSEVTAQVWRQYVGSQSCSLDAHMIPYPVSVQRTGEVTALPDCPEFPDVGGSVLGSFQSSLPSTLTT